MLNFYKDYEFCPCRNFMKLEIKINSSDIGKTPRNPYRYQCSFCSSTRTIYPYPVWIKKEHLNKTLTKKDGVYKFNK